VFNKSYVDGKALVTLGVYVFFQNTDNRLNQNKSPNVHYYQAKIEAHSLPIFYLSNHEQILGG